MKPARGVKKDHEDVQRKNVRRKNVGRKNVRRKKTIILNASADPEHPAIPFTDPPKWYKPIKTRITLRLDADVLAWFKKAGRGYQTRINRALRKAIKEQKKPSGG